MQSIRVILNSKPAALLLLGMGFGLIYNPFTKFPYTFGVIILYILLATFLQNGNIKSLHFHSMKRKHWVLALLAFAIVESTMDFVLQPLLTRIFNEPADYSAFVSLQGNASKYFRYLLFVWISAAFGEELLFRAFAFAQLKKIIGDRKIWIVISSAVLFSLPHLYQGNAGLATTFIFGMLFGLLYERFQNIWINIIVHGLIDTLFLTLAYYGHLSFYS